MNNRNIKKIQGYQIYLDQEIGAGSYAYVFKAINEKNK